jgi:hypothetical protein
MIALITPTGGRPDQIDLCDIYMHRQNYTGKVVWVIVDDCEPRTTDAIGVGMPPNWTVIKCYPNPIWRPGTNTQGRNISVGINTILTNYKKEEIRGFFIIEDDDYYKSFYLV